MSEDPGLWQATGSGKTPYKAVADLVPETTAGRVAHVEGLRQFPDREPPHNDESTTRDITIIYEDLPLKQWRVEVTRREDGWHAQCLGSKRV